MKIEYIRTIQVFENHFIEFKKTLSKDALKKIYQVFMLIMTVEMVPAKFLSRTYTRYVLKREATYSEYSAALMNGK